MTKKDKIGNNFCVRWKKDPEAVKLQENGTRKNALWSFLDSKKQNLLRLENHYYNVQ